MKQELFKTYPLAEVFHSVQGEGTWMGLPMTFVRFAGCSVGKYDFGTEQPATCQAYAGPFQCDTDYRAKFRWTALQIIDSVKPERTMCITGGEPLDHDITEVVKLAHAMNLRVHLETSGTIYRECLKEIDHIACSPKKNCLPEVLALAHELRFLWNPKWRERPDQLLADIDDLILYATGSRPYDPPRVYLSPVNYYDKPNKENLEEVMEVLRTRPTWLLSPQLHKYLNVR